jgi:hypothetical protein
MHFIRLYPKFSNSAGRVPKPSQRLQNIDPLATLTKPPKATRQQNPQTLTRQRGRHPTRPASIYASHQIQKSQNRRAVSVLFTPHSKRQPSQAQRQQPVSPSPLDRNSRNITLLDLPADSGQDLEADPGIPGSDSDSDSNQDIRSGMKSLNLTSGK